jgi:hypothetical protein
VANSVEIVEAYTNWTPPFNVKEAASKMLDTVPPQYLIGLGSVVLTNTAALNRSRRRRKTRSRERTVAIQSCRGLYHAATNQPAWIELFVVGVTQLNVPKVE